MQNLDELIQRNDSGNAQAQRNIDYIIKGCYYSVLLVVVFLFIIRYSFGNVWTHLLSDSAYIRDVIVVPSLVMLVLTFLVSLTIRSGKFSIKVNEILAIHLVIAICSIIMFNHHFTHNILSIYMIPIFISTVFAKPALTLSAYLFSVLGLLFNAWRMSDMLEYHIEGSIWTETFLAIIIITIAYSSHMFS